ncbi:hypothetical protein LTS10_000115 [Elasticomyces elasticus]|nr:hypothetical protein LTS10_000115 [Elasticomyces elasticus]
MTPIKRDHDAMLADGGNNEDNDSHRPDDCAEIDEDQDEDAAVPPYDAKQEPLPPSPVFTPEIEMLKTSVDDLIKLLTEPIEESKYNDGAVEGLLSEIKNRTKSDSPEEIRIALVGDMKAGKSSLINSVLSAGVVARQGDAGGSCTWVVQEFRSSLPNQRECFAAEILFFDQDERHAIIRALFAEYFRASPKDDDLVDDPKDGNQTVEDFAVMRTATLAFRALFNDHKEFATQASATQFMATALSEDDDTILDTLCEWADEKLEAALGAETCIRMEASSPQSLLWELAPFLYSVEEREGVPMVSLWPFVSHIRFGLDNPLLNTGVVLTDLPGLNDR